MSNIIAVKWRKKVIAYNTETGNFFIRNTTDHEMRLGNGRIDNSDKFELVTEWVSVDGCTMPLDRDIAWAFVELGKEIVVQRQMP